MAATDLENTNWTLTAFSEGSSLHPLPTDAEVTLTFGPMFSTKMACPAPLMALEDVYLRILRSVAGWQRIDDTLDCAMAPASRCWSSRRLAADTTSVWGVVVRPLPSHSLVQNQETGSGMYGLLALHASVTGL